MPSRISAGVGNLFIYFVINVQPQKLRINAHVYVATYRISTFIVCAGTVVSIDF